MDTCSNTPLPHPRGELAAYQCEGRFDPGAHYYTREEHSELLDKFSKSTGIKHINLLHLFDEASPGETLRQNLTTNCSVILSGLWCDPLRPGGMDYVNWTMEQIAAVARQDPAQMAQRIVFPFSMAPKWNLPESRKHMAVGVLEWNSQIRHFELSLFEQHAVHDGSLLDRSEQVAAVTSGICQKLSRGTGRSVSVATNLQPYCQERRVCGIVGLETAKTLALSSRPAISHAADTSELTMDADAIAAADAANRRLLTPRSNRGSQAQHGSSAGRPPLSSSSRETPPPL